MLSNKVLHVLLYKLRQIFLLMKQLNDQQKQFIRLMQVCERENF